MVRLVVVGSRSEGNMGMTGKGQAGRTVLVTGASSGIGRAAARRFAAEGARVVAVARRVERLQELAGDLGEACHPMPLDLSDPDGVAEAIGALPPPFDTIDVLVNAAGVALGDAPVQSADWADLRRTIETNALGLVAVTHAVVPQMVARRAGEIVNIGSIAGTYPYPKGHVYGATKAFVRQFSLNLRADLAGLGIRVICVEPGTTETEFAAVRMGQDMEKAKAFYSGRTLLSAEDVAEVIHFAVAVPRHVNLNVMEMMPTEQTFSFFRFAGPD